MESEKIMRIEATVKPNSRLEKIEKVGSNKYKLSVKQPAKEGKANQGAIELLSSYFNIPKSSISLVRGEKSRIKIFEF